MQFAPHTGDDLERILAAVGVADLDGLFAHIPANQRLDRGPDLPPGRSDDEVLQRLERLGCGEPHRRGVLRRGWRVRPRRPRGGRGAGRPR